jgi:hypothetical protein
MSAFIKKVEKHCYMFALTIMNYNFCRKHTVHKAEPAQAAGVASHPMDAGRIRGDDGCLSGRT